MYKAGVLDFASKQRSIQPNPSSRTAKDRKHISTGLYGDGKYLVSCGPLHIQVWSFDEETPLADEGTEYYRRKKQTNARVRERRRSSAAAQAQRRLAGEAEQRISKPLPPDGHIPYLLSRTDFRKTSHRRSAVGAAVAERVQLIGIQTDRYRYSHGTHEMVGIISITIYISEFSLVYLFVIMF